MQQKTKNILLVIGFFLIVMVSYRYAISNTLNIKKEYTALHKEALVFDNLPTQLSALKQKERYFDSLLTTYQLGESSMQNSMLNTINTYADANHLKVVDFNEPHKIQKQDLTINTYEFTIEGSYNSILLLIHQLEQHTKFGEIINLNFIKEKNYKTGKYYLQASILLRSFS